MAVFSLLKFWRNAAGNVDIRNRAPDSDDESDDEDSFFDLVLTGPDCPLSNTTTSVDIKSFDNNNPKHDSHTKNTNILSKKGGQTAQTESNSPDVFSIRKILPIETNSKPQSPISLLRSPPKFRVWFMKSKTDSKICSHSMATPEREQSKRFSMRYEEVPVASFLGRDNSLRSKMQKERFEYLSSPVDESFKKEIGMPKYLKMIRPLYIRASKIRIFDQSTTVTPLSSPAAASVNSPRKIADEKQGSRAAVLRQVCRNLVRIRWATSSTVGPAPVPVPACRRDDSALQQQDGIQSAILHCKRSYSSSSSSSTVSQECTMLSRSASDSSSSHQKAFYPPRLSAEEKRSSI